MLQGDARTPAQKRQGARAWNAVQKVSLKGDARTAAQKAKDRNQVGKFKQKYRKSAKRGLTLSGKVDTRFLKGNARSAKQKAKSFQPVDRHFKN